MIQLTEILSYCPGTSLPGVLIIEYAPISWIQTAERIVLNNNQQKDITFLDDNDWLRLPVIPQGRLWNETSNRTSQGKTYTQVVRGRTPKLRPEVTGEFSLMENDQYLLRLTDREGHKWLLGSLNTPFSITTSSTLDTQNEYNISFEALTSQRATGFVPIF